MKLLITFLAEAISRLIHKADKKKVAFAANIGALLGLTILLVNPSYLVAGIFGGLLLGAIIGSFVFRLPQMPDFEIGHVLFHRISGEDESSYFWAITENALYYCDSRGRPFTTILQKLKEGKLPRVPLEVIVNLQAIDYFEIKTPRSGLECKSRINCRQGAATQCDVVCGLTKTDQDEMLQMIADQCQLSLTEFEGPMQGIRRFTAPLYIGLSIAILFGTLALIAHFLQFRQGRVGDVQQFLINTGASRICLIGIAAMTIPLLWSVWKIFSPQRVRYIFHQRSKFNNLSFIPHDVSNVHKWKSN